MSIYVNFDHLIDYLRKVRKNRIVNVSPGTRTSSPIQMTFAVAEKERTVRNERNNILRRVRRLRPQKASLQARSEP